MTFWFMIILYESESCSLYEYACSFDPSNTAIPILGLYSALINLILTTVSGK